MLGDGGFDGTGECVDRGVANTANADPEIGSASLGSVDARFGRAAGGIGATR